MADEASRTMKLTSPPIVANILGASVFLVLAFIFLARSATSDAQWNLEAAKFFGTIFSAVAVATSIALSK
jgi:uncharacterized membrane protein YbaN (DUF454 family)